MKQFLVKAHQLLTTFNKSNQTFDIKLVIMEANYVSVAQYQQAQHHLAKQQYAALMLEAVFR